MQRMRIPFLVLVISYAIAMTGLLLIDGIDTNGNPYQMSIFDAFYFVTYTASTIGFGETPYPFTYSQKLWVSFVIYIVVLGWFYSIGTLVNILRDKLFLLELQKSKFMRNVKNIKQKYIIILGFSYTTKKIIEKSLQQGIRTVVIEKNEQKVDQLLLENFKPHVPVLIADAFNPKALELAGIKSSYCKAVVSLFEDEALNLRIALTSRLLNKHIIVAAKSTTTNHTENLYDAGVKIVENPFEIIASQINMAIKAPNLLKLENWIHNITTLEESFQQFPTGKYIICGYGRMGHSIHKIFEKTNISSTFIEIDNSKLISLPKNTKPNILIGDADDKDMLLSAGIKDADVVIAGTNNDTINLSILTTAKKLNPNIMTIARENELDDFSIFNNANIKHILMPSRILIYKITNALINPLSDKFIKILGLQDEKWASSLAKTLIQKVNNNPILYELTINNKYAPQIYNDLPLAILKVSLRNCNQYNNIVALLLVRDEEKHILLPDDNIKLQKDDKILFALDQNAKDDLEYICQNIYEFHYALTGKEKFILKNKGI
ncbi:Potassium channel protein [hydrothermal vent metagenome]|uniref:Potassium channel protein n=1 Tax=hydrothermal vent metagenome TaxID=652676 RepID=A0A3B1EAB4_9ZZZZ